jgi:hypothetical protein
MAEMLRIISHSAEETRALGEKLAARLAPGMTTLTAGCISTQRIAMGARASVPNTFFSTSTASSPSS